ncbi:MAG: Gfo/Idh/MocA family oxidoreductase [Chloroflexota bacterium]|nr:Gfo/Idh/MocA family oxidoreductase [Chloroflexota bacterium]
MTQPLRIGLVGAGRIVPAHLRAYAALRAAGVDDFRITAICSRDPVRARAYARAGGPGTRTIYGGNDPLAARSIGVADFQDDVVPDVYTDVRAMLDAGAVEAVDITTEVGLHHVQALACLEAGVHALIEKPLAITMRAGRAMVEAAKQRGLVLAVCENARFNRPVRIAAWVMRRGDLGTPQMALFQSLGTAYWSPDRWVGNSPWRHQKLVGAGGASLDVGPHIFHRLRNLCGEVETVTAIARTFEPVRYLRDEDGTVTDTVDCDTDDAFMAVATFASGAIGQLSFSFAGHGEPTIPAGPIVYGRRGCLKAERLLLDGAEETTLDAYFAQHATDADRERLFPRGMSDQFGLLIGDWLRAIRERRDGIDGEAETSGEEGLRDLAASFAIVESSLAGCAVSAADVLSGRVDAYQRDLDAHYGLGE